MNDIGSDGLSSLDRVKSIARRIGADICETMNCYGKTVEQLRARMIVFRDYLADGEHAMMVTDFFQLAQETDEYNACLDSSCANGGGDLLEDGLEALGYAIRSEWAASHLGSRKVILVWSDAGTHNLGYGIEAQNYPKGMAKNLDELYGWWEALGHSKRLLLFVPDEGYWNYIANEWEYVLQYPSAAGERLSEGVYDELLKCVASNI